jgi:hypothetical protein
LMRSLEHHTVFRYTAEVDKKADIIGQYLAGLSNRLSTTISAFSIFQRSLEYKKQDRLALGRHSQVTSDGRAEAFIPVIGENSASINGLGFLTARFGRNMAEFASSQCVRYQFDSPTDKTNVLGWGEQAFEGLEV